MTWNLHGKGIKHLSSLLAGLEKPPDVLFLQELGDVKGLAEGAHRDDLFDIAGELYVGYVANPRHSWRCSAIIIACSLEFSLLHVHVVDVGIHLAGSMLKHRWHLSTLHFPHAHRSDAVDVWRNACAAMHELLHDVHAQDCVIIGHDLNQDAHAAVDEFAGMLHYRQLLARTGLELSPPQGDTWIARGSSSAIDFYMYHLPRIEVSFYKREDLRTALPSDHNPIGMRLQVHGASRRKVRRQRSTLCGKWAIDAMSFLQELDSHSHWDQDLLTRAARVKGVSVRPASLKYRDPPHILELIALRKRQVEPQARQALMQEIHQQRQQAQQDHKLALLERAKLGDHRAISHLRASAAGGFTEGSYIHRAGGLTQAPQDLHAFYARKFTSLEEPLTSAHWQAAEEYHLRVPAPTPIDLDEVTRALDKCNSGVSAGLDGITYEGLKGLLRLDPQECLVRYMNDLLQGVKPIPASWRLGKIVFLPKVPRPSKPADLRPICLVPTLSRLFSKILMERLRPNAPEYHANQMACRPSVQVVDGILAAQSTMALIRTTTGNPAKVAKLDIKAAFDSISHHAVYRWLMACRPGWEAERIMHLCFDTRVVVSIGGESKELPMQQGIMQGSAFSADIFSRVVDWYLGGLLPRMDELEPQWNESVACLPHFLIYADDITVFATTEAALQAKVRLLVSTLEVIGLHVNPDKCRVLQDPGGTCPGLWLPRKALPLPGADTLLFLGVPLGHGVGASSIMTHLMRKSSNSFFAFKKILDAPRTPLTLKLPSFRCLHFLSLVLGCSSDLSGCSAPSQH